MWSSALAERLQDAPIRFEIHGAQLDVLLVEGAPAGYALPSDLQAALLSEAKQIGLRASDVQRKLNSIVEGRDVKKWQEFHNRLVEYKRWPEAVTLATPYSCLCSWTDAHRHLAEAKKVIKERGASGSATGGKQADLSWNSRRLAIVEKRVIQYAMLNPDFHELVMGLKG